MPTKSTPAADPAVLTRKTKKVSLQLRCLFTEKELLEKGKQIAENHAKKAELEDEISTIKTQFKSKIEAVDAQIKSLSLNITAGWEYRAIVCTVRFDDPAPGKKTIYRADSAEVVQVEDMTLYELQGELPLAESGSGKPESKPEFREADSTGNVTTPGDKE